MRLRCESIICSNERESVCVLFTRKRDGEQSGREDGDHHKQLLVTVEVSSFDLDTHSTATRIVVVTAEDKIDLGCHRYSCYKRYE